MPWIVVIFTFIGPIVGGVIAAVLGMFAIIDLGPGARLVDDVVKLLTVGVVFAFPMGGPAALVTGIYFELVSTSGRPLRYWEAAVAGFNAEGYYFMLMDFGRRPITNSIEVFLIMAFIGAVASLVCLALCRRWRLIGRQTST